MRTPHRSDPAAPLDLDRLERWHRFLVQTLEQGMDPGLIVAVLFFHWLQTLYLEGALRDPPDPDRLPRIERDLVAWLRARMPVTSPDRRLRAWADAIHQKIRDLYPRRILHQRDIDRFTRRLVDALEGGLAEVVQTEADLTRWRREVFFLWWCLRSYLDRSPADLDSPAACRDQCDAARDWIIEQFRT